MPFAEMRAIFNERANLQRRLDVEAALARAEATLGMIPEEAAREISANALVERIDEELRQQVFQESGQAILALVRSLEAVCKGESGGYIHWGATSQDIIDTANVLALKQAYHIVFDALREIENNLLLLAEREAETVMAGRTHGQHALPITFGFKVAVWIRELRRHIERLKECRKRLLVGQLAGAVGTFASFGDDGPKVQELVMRELGLGIPDICWHASGDRSAEFACILAMVASTLGKIAAEIYALQSTELGEVDEGFEVGKIYSSTMPHKRNPRDSEQLLALCKRMRGYAPLLIEAMMIEHERGGAGWYVQRDSLAGMCLLMGEILDRGLTLSSALRIQRQRMEENLGLQKGLMLSEPVMLELGRFVGRQKAHELVYESSMRAHENRLPLLEVLLQDPRVARHLSRGRLESLLDPRNYLGLSVRITREVVALTWEQRDKEREELAE